MHSDVTDEMKICSTLVFDMRRWAEARVVPSPALNMYFVASHCRTTVGAADVSDVGGARIRTWEEPINDREYGTRFAHGQQTRARIVEDSVHVIYLRSGSLRCSTPRNRRL